MNIKDLELYRLNPIWQYKRFLNRIKLFFWDLKEYFDFNGITVYFDDVECPEKVYIPSKTVIGLDYNQIAYIALTKAYGGSIDDVMCESDEKDVAKLIKDIEENIEKKKIVLNMGDDTYTDFFRNKKKERECYVVDITFLKIK